MASLLQISLHILRLSHGNLQRKIEEQRRTMKKPAMKRQSGLRICYKFDEPTTICEELQRTGQRGGGGGIVLNILKLS